MYIPKYNLFSMHNATCRYGVRTDLLWSWTTSWCTLLWGMPHLPISVCLSYIKGFFSFFFVVLRLPGLFQNIKKTLNCVKIWA